MRSDWPVVLEEDCIEPPCEIFLQLFIQNVEMAVDDNSDDNEDDYDFSFGNVGELNEQDADELVENFGPIVIEDDSFTDDSDDSLEFSIPSPCPITDAELTPSSSDEVESEIESDGTESNNDDHCNQNSLSGMSQHSEESTCIQSIACNESQQQVLNCEPEEILGANNVHPKRGPKLSSIFDGSEEMSVTDIQSKRESSRSDVINNLEDAPSITDICSSGESRCSDLIGESEEVPLVTEVQLKRGSKYSNVIDGGNSGELPLLTHAHPRSKDSETALSTTDVQLKSENSEAAGYSNIVPPEFENYFDVISTKDVSSNLPCVKEESSVEFDSSAGNMGLKRSTHVSLYVVVPPTNFLNERSSGLLSGVSTSLPGLIPVNPNYHHYPSLPTSGRENFQLANTSKENSISSFDKLASCSSTVSHIITEDNQKSNISDADFVLDNLISGSKLENTCFNNEYSELCGHDTILTEGTGILENNESSEISEKCVSSLKRKVSSVDDSILIKIPKYSSETSNDLINQKSLDYCTVLTNHSENILQTSHEDIKIDVVPPTVVSDNVTLKLGKSVEQATVLNEKPKSR